MAKPTDNNIEVLRQGLPEQYGYQRMQTISLALEWLIRALKEMGVEEEAPKQTEDVRYTDYMSRRENAERPARTTPLYLVQSNDVAHLGEEAARMAEPADNIVGNGDVRLDSNKELAA